MNAFIETFIIVGFTVTTVATYYYAGSSRQLFWSGQNSQLLQGVIAALIMLIGIFVGTLFRQIIKKGHRINIIGECKEVFSSVGFWAAICASPLVFLSIFAITGDDPDRTSTYILAFENGFFCQVVFKGLLDERRESGP